MAEIDRAKVCPFLLRCFWNLDRNNNDAEYKNAARDGLPKNEVQIYTWSDATLQEIKDLLKDVVPAARKPSAMLHFSLVYPDRNGNHVMREIGRINASHSGPDDAKTLSQCKFQTGDYLDIAIHKKDGGAARMR